MENPRVFVTGGDGFVGKSLRRTRSKAYVYDTSLDPQDDIRDLRRLKDAMNTFKPNIVVHLAALISAPQSEQPEWREAYTEVNVTGTEHVLRAAEASGVDTLLFSSSATARDPESSYYAKTKSEGEKLLTEEAGSVRTIIFQNENLYGPGQNPETPGLVTVLCQKALRREALHMHGDGSTEKDFLYVDDLASLMRDAVLLDHTTAPNGSTYQVGTGQSTPIRDIFHFVSSRFPGTVIEQIPTNGYTLNSRANVAPLLHALGRPDFPFTPLHVGLEATARSIQASFAR